MRGLYYCSSCRQLVRTADPTSMPDFRRYFVAGGTYFFTLVTCDRRPIVNTDAARRILREKISRAQRDWPFEMPAIVLLPDHLHAIWSLPPGDAAYPKRWGW